MSIVYQSNGVYAEKEWDLYLQNPGRTPTTQLYRCSEALSRG